MFLSLLMDWIKLRDYFRVRFVVGLGQSSSVPVTAYGLDKVKRLF